VCFLIRRKYALLYHFSYKKLHKYLHLPLNFFADIWIKPEVQEKFSWKSVVSAGLTAGIMQGLDAVLPKDLMPKFSKEGFGWNDVARSAIQNTVQQGVNVSLGLQEKFDWRGVVAAGVGAAVGYGAGKVLGNMLGSAAQQGLGKAAVQAGSQFAAGVTRQLITKKGKLDWVEVAVDAFGNTLANSIVGYLSRPSVPDSIKQLSREQQGKAIELAKRANVDLNNSDHAHTILKTLEAQQGQVPLSAQERLNRISDYLKLAGATDDVVAQARQAYIGSGVILGLPTTEKLLRDTSIETQLPEDPSIPRLRPIIVTANRSDQSPSFISSDVDITLVGTGQLVEKFGKFVDDNPVAKYTLMGLDIAAGPAAYAVRQAVEHSRIGEAIRDGQEAFVGYIGDKLSAVGFTAQEGNSGGVGAMTLLTVGAQGFTSGIKSINHTIEQIAARRSLREALGLAKGAPFQAHHLIPVAVARTSPAIQHLIDKGLYNINHKGNGMALPNNAKLAEELGMPYHSGSHDKYSAVVSDKIREIDRDFRAGKLTDQQLLTRVINFQDHMRAHVSKLKGRLN
jgi:hypothetical protein